MLNLYRTYQVYHCTGVGDSLFRWSMSWFLLEELRPALRHISFAKMEKIIYCTQILLSFIAFATPSLIHFHHNRNHFLKFEGIHWTIMSQYYCDLSLYSIFIDMSWLIPKKGWSINGGQILIELCWKKWLEKIASHAENLDNMSWSCNILVSVLKPSSKSK